MRLDKYLSDMNAGTRKEVKTAIRKKRVTVDGRTADDPAMAVSGQEQICLDGQNIAYNPYEYYMMNKPAGVLSATSDAKRRTVLDLMDERRRKDLFPVGRLDIDTEGLLLITNDGDLAHRLLLPRFHVDKTYYTVVLGKLSGEDIRAFASGLKYDTDLTAAPAELSILPEPCEPYRYTDNEGTAHILTPDMYSRAEVTIHEGKFHQIKKMFSAVGKQVLYLKRISMGPISLDGSLPPGGYRALTEEEMNQLRAISV